MSHTTTSIASALVPEIMPITRMSGFLGGDVAGVAGHQNNDLAAQIRTRWTTRRLAPSSSCVLIVRRPQLCTRAEETLEVGADRGAYRRRQFRVSLISGGHASLQPFDGAIDRGPSLTFRDAPRATLSVHMASGRSRPGGTCRRPRAQRDAARVGTRWSRRHRRAVKASPPRHGGRASGSWRGRRSAVGNGRPPVCDLAAIATPRPHTPSRWPRAARTCHHVRHDVDVPPWCAAHPQAASIEPDPAEAEVPRLPCSGRTDGQGATAGSVAEAAPLLHEITDTLVAEPDIEQLKRHRRRPRRDAGSYAR